MKFKIFKFKDGKKGQWKEWCNVLNARKEEVVATLLEEKVTHELGVCIGDYFLYGMEGECLPASDCELNREHKRNFRECLGPAETMPPGEGQIWFNFQI